MAGMASSPQATNVTRKPGSQMVLLIAGCPILLLIVSMAWMRLSSPEEATEPIKLPRVSHPLLRPVPADPTTQSELEKVLSTQLSAIQRQDYNAAIATASPEFQEHINAKRFETMIERNFRIFLNPAKTEIHRGQVTGELATVRITLTDSKAKQEGFIYQLEKFGSNWTIVSCTPIRTLDPAANGAGFPGRFPRPMTPIEMNQKRLNQGQNK